MRCLNVRCCVRCVYETYRKARTTEYKTHAGEVGSIWKKVEPAV